MGKNRILFVGFFLSLVLSAVFLLISYLQPTSPSPGFYQRGLTQLRKQKTSISAEFTKVIRSISEKHTLLSSSHIPENPEELFPFIKKLCLNPTNEGIGYYGTNRKLLLWYGQVIDLQPILAEAGTEDTFRIEKASLLVQDKASFYLVSFQPVRQEETIVIYRLLGFLPQFKAQYLKEYHFLKEKLLENCQIRYWDFREDVSGFERIFVRHEDEYIGQPRLQDEIQTIFFPLRNENNQIVATVTLSSPSLPSKLTERKENTLLVFHFFLGASLLFLVIYLIKLSLPAKVQKLWLIIPVTCALVGLRVIFFPLSQLERIQSLSIFSPSKSSLISVGDLTKSPADIFLTTLFLFLVLSYLTTVFQNLIPSLKKNPSRLLSLSMLIFIILLSTVLIIIFHNFLTQLVLNSSLNLLRISLEPSFFLLQLSIFLFLLGIIFVIFTGFKILSALADNPWAAFFILLLAYGTILTGSPKNIPILISISHVLLMNLILLLSHLPAFKHTKKISTAIFLAAVFLVYVTINHTNARKHRSLLQNSLKSTIESQENWASFFLQQSLPEIDKQEKALDSLFQGQNTSTSARNLWEITLMAKFNWYSSLEIVSKDGTVLSRFSLNIPELYQPILQHPISEEWFVHRQNISFWNRENDFLIAYKDWMVEDNHLGRVIVYLAIDYKMLPFLYSANPYFELLRTTSFPSLNQIHLVFTVFDLQGRISFNPNEISSGIPPDLLEKITSSEDAVWTTFSDKDRTYQGLFFKDATRIYSLFIPKKTYQKYFVEYSRLLILYLSSFFIIYILTSAAGRKKRWKDFLWSFSNRVYISFVAIALIPLFLFTLSTQTFFARFFSQKVTEEAETHANFAQRVTEDYILQQQEEQVSLTIPPDDMVFWISTTISNDVNLYLDGRITSSSHREFFHNGLLPELIDGEVFFNIQYENNPFYTQTQKIGDYSFLTLTIPYSFQEATLLISLPFPLEQQEISRSTEELIEFLFFLSVFFVFGVLLFAWRIGGTIIKPIKKLLTGTREVSLGNFEVSIPYKHQDEMKTLVDGFNSMVKSLKKHQQEMAELSKKIAWAEMARKVAHEIKNPLTPIQLSAEHLLRVYQDNPEDFQNALEESTSYIVKEVENLRQIAHQFLETSRETVLQREEIDIREIVRETLEPYRKTLAQRIHITETFQGEEHSIFADKAKVKIALRNILTNSIESITKHGKIDITVLSSDKEVKVGVADSGTGIKKDILDKIFEPYFSTKDAGTGLGLPIAKKIVEDHGGRIQASLNKPNGLRVEIILPKL